MRVSEGVPRGRFVELYNPEMLNECEEVKRIEVIVNAYAWRDHPASRGAD